MKHLSNRRLAAALLLFCSSAVWGHSAMFPDGFKFDDSNEGDPPPAMMPAMQAATLCQGGSAGGYPCNNVDLMSFVAKADMGGGSANLNDIWGYSDPQTGAEIALVGRNNGTSFVDVTIADAPVYLGFLPSHNNGSDSWRDIKVYNDHAFIVADGGGNSSHGLQVFDLRTLRNLPSPGQTLSETAHMNGFGNAHNIAINEDSGYAYVVGSNQCSGGLYMVDISDPLNPQYAGCFSSDGYTHDAQCVIYGGPDTEYSGREICVGYNEDTITIVDVTDKFNPMQVSRTLYQGSQYTHQGWFLDGNHSTLIMNDELDESRNGHNTTSYIYDVSDLENPAELGRYVGPTPAIDHNLYTKDGYVYETNYRAGLRILDAANIASGQMSEVAYFDTIPNSNSAQFSGTWSNYAYFASGNVILSDIGNGLFVVRPDWDAINNPDPDPGDPQYCSAASNNASEEWIGEVSLATFSHSSGSSTYSDFTTQMVNLEEGANAVSLAPAFSGSSYGEYWKIWIDLNSDGDFDDSGEEVFSSGGTSSSRVTGTLTLPTGSAGVSTRLRIAMRYNAAPSPCGSFNYGEVEDYSVTIGSGGGGGGGDSDPVTYSNTGSYSIPDNNATGVSSPIDVDRSGASESISVSVDITHTYIGDLEVDLLAPGGTVFNLHNRSGGSADDIVQTYNLDAGTVESSGQWSLRVRDRANLDTGTINQWSLTFQ
ncbi:choice-of-anchor B family protein [Microbulbifer rhizosphaerae]|uniref:Choice-of-anchor B domain-containing protein n=1 Tax=Microbulbifer rhizosphaerae TaxID=1562603 RepID=A0A7W4WFH1_9GAMM|nr:choice-of-anchor B family protein [Microbulbifer rhizosphaerae]MBB3062708.1 choice-of-anchor B domain-containing protein [Microbulbifer rhizosphaerae]